MPTPVHALRADLPALADALVSAFADDPLISWMYPDPALRPDHSRHFFESGLENFMRMGHLYGIGDNAGAALWSPPDVDPFPEAQLASFDAMLRADIGARADEVFAGLLTILPHHPEEPHFYLFILGVHQDLQGKGFGGELMRPISEKCDAQGVVAYLESSNIRNVPFYERHGYEVIAEVELPDGPIIRPMVRQPR